jgi:hypothetical protein
MDGETLLRERFAGAVGDITPDLVGLVAGGTEVGRGLVRRRRMQGGAGLVAAAALVVGSLALVDRTDLLGSDGPTGQGTVMQYEPATARGLAAAVMTHSDGLGTLIAVGGGTEQAEVVSDSAGLSAEVAYTLADGGTVDLQVIATPGPIKSDEDVTCPKTTTPEVEDCEPVELADGSYGAFITYRTGDIGRPAGDQVTAATALALRRGDELVAVIQYVSGTDGLPWGKAALLDLLTDPVVGVSTTAALNDAGEQIAEFHSGIGSGSSSSSGSGSAPPPVVQEEPTGPGTVDSSSASSR